MTRVKGAVHTIKRRRSLLSKTKGYRFGRSSKERQAKEAWLHATAHAFKHRKEKKAAFRGLWNIKISGALKTLGSELSYSRFIDALNKKNVLLNRKMLATLAEHDKETFERVVKHVA